MWWLRSVGSIKFYVSFAEYYLFCRALLQKRPIILSILLADICQMTSVEVLVQGGEDSEDALSCRSFFAKEPLVIGLFCGK